jgi:membrane-associated phospholipid phosphatase
MGLQKWTSARAAAVAVLVFAFGLGGFPCVLPACAGQAASGAGTPGQEKADRLTLKDAGREFLSDAGRIWSSPARVRGKDILPLVGLAAATAALIVSDESTRDGVQTYANRHAWVGDVAPVITHLGDYGAFATAGAFFAAGLIFKDARARDTGYLAASALLQTLLVDNSIKGLTGRRRPSVADGEGHWAGPAGFFERFEKGQAELYTSFPSGHTSAAFSLATVIALQYRHTGWVPVLAYTLAGGVGLSRMALDRHWASDVAAGAVLGYFVGRLVVRNHDRRGRLVAMAGCTGRGFAVSIVYDLGPVGY